MKSARKSYDARLQSTQRAFANSDTRPLNSSAKSVLLVDLNNFATFPTLAVGLLVATLRNAGLGVQLISPLAHDVPAAERERSENVLDQIKRRIHLSTWRPVRTIRDLLRSLRRWWLERPHPGVLRETEKALKKRPDALLLSAYLQHYRTVELLGQLAKRYDVPMIVGGPMFNIESAAHRWLSIPGMTAIVGGESDFSVTAIVSAARQPDELLRIPGITLPDGRRSQIAPPLRPLDGTPVPDFCDFPWDRYRLRIIPIMAGRGCQWNRCNFCSDIVSVSGRTFRGRSLDHVLHEMREQSRRHSTRNFLFLDLKLNSNPSLLRGIVENVQRQVPGAQWIGTVHVDRRRDNGLSRTELKAAAKAGMRRISFGLETGSQRLLDAMDKGCTVEGNSEFIRNAHEAGLSVRCTMFKGFPGETAADLVMTAEFLEAHSAYIDRIRFNEFSLPAGTPIYEAVMRDPATLPQFQIRGFDAAQARAVYQDDEAGVRAYRKAKSRVLRAVHNINRKTLRDSARAFDGLM